jgi:serine/threonine-protein phosphatase 2A regulatory subunit A
MSTDTVEYVDALELFKEEIRSDDLSTRIECIADIKIIAHALGKQKALSVLVPLVSECVKGVFCPDDDEVLLAFAKHLPDLIPFLPSDSGPSSIVPILESLASQDETVIREAAVVSLGRIAQSSQSACSETCFPALVRLFKAEWFSPKLSACGLSHYVYSHVADDGRNQIRSLFISCAKDETPMVKRAAAANLHRLLSVVEKGFILSEFIPVYQSLAQDETQETVRTSCVMASQALCRILNETEATEFLRDTVSSLALDKSWRVRLAIAKIFGEICRSIGRESTRSHMLEPLVLLMRDQEPDVRKAAVEALTEAATLLPVDDFVSSIVPQFAVISKDPVQQVRSALSGCIGSLAKNLGKEFTLTQLLPLLLESVKDDHPTIRYNATSSIGSICEVLSEPDNQSTVTQLINLLHQLSQDANWRTRLAVLEQLPILCRLFGKDLFEARLESLFLSFFGDSVHAVRAALTDEVGQLVDHLGPEWTTTHFVGRILMLYSESNSYSSRIAILQTLPKLASKMESDEGVLRILIPVLERGCKDVVPNVRFIACSIAKELKGAAQALKPTLEPLTGDTDIDVQFFAKGAIESLGEVAVSH